MKTRLLMTVIAISVISTSYAFAESSSPNELIEISLKGCNPVELKSTISSGNLQFVCHSSITNSVKAMVNADSDGTITLEIPKFLLYSLTDSQCNTSNDFLVLVKGVEVASKISDNENTNLVTVDFAKGITEIEIIGTTILPDPSPSQYCGIVEGYEKQFLAPLDQADHGVKPEFIRCNTGLVLIQKYDGTPACVKPDTATELQTRWHKSDATEQKFEIVGMNYQVYPDIPLIVSVAKIGYDMCDSWDAKIIDVSDNSTVWERDFHTGCVVLDPPTQQKFEYKISNENNPIIVSEVGDYVFQITIGNTHLEKEFIVRNNFSGGPLDKTYSEIPNYDSNVLNCNDVNPYNEYECFRDAFSNCQLAKVNLDIYTIEGSPIHTNAIITNDCKIYGIIDTTTDIHGDRGIIKTTCETLSDDQYGWSIKDCDALNYSEMQFNFEMQLYPKILECEKNGNTWVRERLECMTENERDLTTIKIEIGNPINNRGLAPVTTTQTTRNAESMDSITAWDFQPTDYGTWGANGERTSWDILPSENRIYFNTYSKNGSDTVKLEWSPAREDSLHVNFATCEDESIEILSGAPVSLPVPDGFSTLSISNAVGGLLPVNNQYTLSFASFFKHEIVLPDNAVILSQTHKNCLIKDGDYTTGNLDRVIFKLENEN